MININLKGRHLISNISTIFPRLLVNLICGYSFYSVGILISLRSIRNSNYGNLFFIITLTLYLHDIITYYRVVQVGPGFTTNYSNLLALEDDEEGTPRLPPDFLTTAGSEEETTTTPPRICNKCHLYKPPRTHHCSSCNGCVLKMDHHCPWFALCVGAKNHKFFIQFLLSSLIYSFWCLGVSVWYFSRFFADGNFNEEYLNLNIIINGVIALSMSVSLTIFDSAEIYFLLTNMTTIEYYQKSDYNKDVEVFSDSFMGDEEDMKWVNPYDLGSMRQNWEAVMGTTVWEWIMPVRRSTLGDYYKDEGIKYVVNLENVKKMRRNNNRLRYSPYTENNVHGRLLGQLQNQ